MKLKKSTVKFDYKNYNKTLLNVKKNIDKNGYCVLKNFNTVSTHSKIFNEIKKKYKVGKDVKYTGEQKLKNKDFQRLDIGNSFENARFMRVMSFYQWNKNNNFFFSLINPAIRFRNELSKVSKENFIYPNVKPIVNRLHNKDYIYAEFVRMIQYPLGGGFLAEHHDYTKYYGKGIIGMLIPLTFKNTSKNKKYDKYSDGGLYFKNKNNSFFVDDISSIGDIIFFNPKIKHGVKSVNPKSPNNMKTLNGRLTLAFSVSRFRI